MPIAFLVLCVALFVILSPGTFLKLPSANSSKFVSVIVHSVIFFLILYFAGDFISSELAQYPGLEGYARRNAGKKKR